MDRISAISNYLSKDLFYPVINRLTRFTCAIIGVHKSTNLLNVAPFNDAPLNNFSVSLINAAPQEIVGKMLRNLALSELVLVGRISPAFFSEADRILKLHNKKDLSNYVLSLIEQGDETSLETLSEMDNEIFHVFDEDTGKTLLHNAIARGNDKICDILIKAKSLDINARDDCGNTPLHYAIKFKNIKLFDKLINMANAILDDGHETFFDNTPLNPMMKRWCVAVVPYQPILHFAVESNSLESVELLLKNEKANVNVLDYYGNVALTKAFARKTFNKKLVNIIVNHKLFDVHYQNREGRSLLFFALMHGLNEMIDILVQKGIDINQDCISKGTPLHVAALHGNIEAVRKLIKLPNINVNIKNDKGLTPYQVALRTAENKECPSEKRSRSRDIMELLQGKTTDKIF